MHRSPTATTEARLLAVEALLLEGAGRRDVVAHARQEWGLAPRSADRLLALARERIRAGWELERRDMAALILSQLSSLQQEARERDNLAVALGCINATARLCGLI